MSHTPERRKNISGALKGRTLSDEHRANLSRAAKAAWERRRVRWRVEIRQPGMLQMPLVTIGSEQLANAYRAGFLHGSAHTSLCLTPMNVVVVRVQGDGEA